MKRNHTNTTSHIELNKSQTLVSKAYLSVSSVSVVDVHSLTLRRVSVDSADVNPEHHVRILEALIATGGLVEMQAAPGRTTHTNTHSVTSHLCCRCVHVLWRGYVQCDFAGLGFFCELFCSVSHNEHTQISCSWTKRLKFVSLTLRTSHSLCRCPAAAQSAAGKKNLFGL